MWCKYTVTLLPAFLLITYIHAAIALKAGQYTITSHLNSALIGDDSRGDKNGGLKKVILLPSNFLVQNIDAVAAPKWVVEPQDGDHYIVRVNGRPTLAIGGELYSAPETQGAEQWVITQHGWKGPYTVEKADKSGGWKVVDDLNPHGSIYVCPLGILPGFPPRFPSSSLFDFTLVEAS
ncbi:hypothetical protein BV22DRAFT_1031950 [Leucogyrophana mollusca]|uniref:Uncharacterized protein n=1 Tax=Leucogyrophana mollusca TaxID=85980 RepID=A0ACB8BN81_9AGAM|nr:hypothetical protein BV22DRAFT_1031950 [Leucogyrophana mollusca]